MLLKTFYVIIPLFILIFFFRRHLVTVLDIFLLSKSVNFPIAPGSMWMQEGSSTLNIESFRGLDIVQVHTNGTVTFNVREVEFLLGSLQKNTDNPSTSYLVPGEGDKINILYQHGYFSWPTPFEMNFMTGYSPSWKRNSYYTLTWLKADGGALSVRWRFQQWKYHGNEWNDWRSANDGPNTGLIEMKIIDFHARLLPAGPKL